MTITKEDARKFILRKQGLIGKHRFQGKAGCLSFIEQVGCIQFDPIDRCGKNIDIVLFSRVSDYNKTMIDALMYQDFKVVTQWDKNMSIYAVKDWPNLERTRQKMSNHYGAHLASFEALIQPTLDILYQEAFVEAKDLNINASVTFYTWRHKKLSQAVLDYLFFKGDILVHHRKGIKRYFGLTSKYIDDHILSKEQPFKTIEAYHRFMFKRRIGAVGMLGSGPSDAFLGIYGMKAMDRRKRFAELVELGEIIEIHVKDVGNYYLLKEDAGLLHVEQKDTKRVEFIAPLDSFIWDRKLISKIFDFDYKWEIYTPEKDRIYGPYVLPVLYGDSFVGRIDMRTDSKTNTLYVHHLWLERENLDQTFHQLLKDRIHDFALFNGCKEVIYDD